MRYVLAALIGLILTFATTSVYSQDSHDELTLTLNRMMMTNLEFRAELIDLIIAYWPDNEPIPVGGAGQPDAQAMFNAGNEAGLVNLVVSDNPSCYSYIGWGMNERDTLAERMKWRQKFINNCI